MKRVDLWKAGGRQATFLLYFMMALVTFVEAQMPPANDKCMNQMPVGDGTIVFCTDFATTTDYFVGSGKFAFFNFYQIKQDVFFCYTATATGTLKLSISGFPGVAVGLASTCDCSSASPLSLFNSCATGNPVGVMSENVVMGQSILIRVGSCDGNTGMVTMNIVCDPEKKNNRCATPNLVLAGSSEPFDFANTTLDGPDPLGLIDADLWYAYSPGCDEAVTLSACGTSGTSIAVYGFQTGCPNPGQLIAAQPGACSALGTELSTNLVEGETYLIQLGAPTGTSPSGTFEISAQSLLPPPANDECANAVPIVDGLFPFDTRCATPSLPGGSPLCDFFGDDRVSNDVWYEYTAVCSETVFLDLSTSSYDTKVSVHTTCDPAAAPIACNDDSNNSVTSRLRFQTAAGQSYFVRVGGYLGFTGVGEMHVYCAPDVPPVNDDVANPLPITVGLTQFTNRGGSTDGPEDCECDVKKDVWYRYVGTEDCLLTVSLCGSSFDTTLAIYPEPLNPGALLVPGDELDCVDDSCSYQSEVSAPVLAGQAILLRVGGWNDIEGDGELAVSCLPLVANFVRGQCNSDAAFDISDAIFLVNYLFQGAGAPTCEDACDANDDGQLNIADIVSLLTGLFGQPAMPLPPPNACGPDPTPTAAIDCASFPGC